MAASAPRPSTAISTWSVIRASTVLRALAALHVIAMLAMVPWPGAWPAWVAVLACAHASIVLLAFQPRNRLFGANLSRLPAAAVQRGEVALTFDDGPDPHVTPQVLDILAGAGVRASFFVVGDRLASHPEIARAIVAQGHSLENHTGHHGLLFALSGVDGLRQEIELLQARALEVCGTVPEFFRPPAGFHSPLLAPLLAAMGLRLATWTRRGFDTRERNAERVKGRLLHNLSAGDILLLHDGNAARDHDHHPVVLTVLPALLDEIKRRGLRAVTLPQALRPAQAPLAESR